MASSEAIKSQLQHLILHDVVSLDHELGRGSYGRVFTVEHCRLVCAAKEIHPILVETAEQKETFKDNFVQECLNCSNIRHPNIVQFMGIFYSPERADFPIMVMELMSTSLTSFVQNHSSDITLVTKISILDDISLGLSHLHMRRPPVIHRDLSSNNILLNQHLVAKIGDLGVAKVIRAESQTTKKFTKAPGTVDFMPPEALEEDPVYDTPVDVFSFAGISLHLLCEEWPSPLNSKKRDPEMKKYLLLSEVQRRQQYLDKITGRAVVLKELITKCLDDEPDERPTIQEVSEIIVTLKVCSTCVIEGQSLQAITVIATL